MRRYKIIHRDSKTGMNLRVKPEGGGHPFGFSELDGVIQSENWLTASEALRLILIKALKDAGFVWKDESTTVKKSGEFVECTAENPCCGRRDEYNGFASGPPLFECPKHCRCHD